MLHRNGVLVLAIAAATVAAGQPVTPADRAAGIEAFEKVWTTVLEKHWDPKLGGLDWQAVHDELRPKIDAAKTRDEARAVMASMLARLNQTHFGVFPGEVYRQLDAPEGPQTQFGAVTDTGDATPGIDARA